MDDGKKRAQPKYDAKKSGNKPVHFVNVFLPRTIPAKTGTELNIYAMKGMT